MPDQESTLKPGDVIAEYRIEKVLGSGSFGVTYLAHDTQLARGVAIKEYMPVMYARRDVDGTVASRNLDTSATFEWGLERFSEEARTLAQFNHPNIVKVLRLVQGLHGTAYIAMELLQGINLEIMVERDGPLPPERFLSIFRQILDGCESIHKIGILHRDIKPANIVIRDDTPVLIDFGAARDLSLQQKAGFSAVVTDGYSPLEQYSRETRQTEATDIYALAATGYFLITGRTPPPSAARSGGESMPTALSAGQGLIADDILRAIDWGLTLQMAERPQTIGDWRAAMKSLDAPEPGLPAAIAAARPAISRRALLIAGGGIVLAGGAAFALFNRDTSLSASARPLRVAWTRPFARLSTEPYAAVAVTANGAMVAAHRVGDDDNDYLLALNIDDAGTASATFVSPDPGSRGHAILPTADGGAWVGGESGSSKSTLVRLGKDWKPVWTRTYADGSITSIMPRQGGIVAGLEGPQNSGAAKLLYIADDGSLQSDLTLLDRQGDSVQNVAQLPDRGIAVLGLRIDERIVGGQTRRISGLWVARLAENGEEKWRVSESGLGYANGWDIAEANGDLYVTGRTNADGEDASWRMLLMRISGQGKKLWSKWDYPGVPSSGRGLAAVGSGGGTSLYLAGWAGNPHAPRWSQIGPDGALVWDQVEPAAGAVSKGASGLALREQGGGFAIGLQAENASNLQLTVSRLT
jgi:serine/threonine protein kinase